MDFLLPNIIGIDFTENNLSPKTSSKSFVIDKLNERNVKNIIK